MPNFARALTHHRKAKAALTRRDSKTAAHHMGHALAALRSTVSDDFTEDNPMAGKNFIKGAIKNPGGLHRALGVPEGKTIPAAKVSAAANSSDPHLARMANLAKTLKKINAK